MKVLVATSDVPFVEGGHRIIARSLTQALREAGHEAEIFTTPQNRFGRQFAAYLATRITDVQRTGRDERVDKLISIRFPSYALKHPDHVCWLNHRMREYYDLWAEWSSRLSWKGKIKESIRRELIHAADSYFLKKNVRKIFAQSEAIKNRLQKWGNIPSEVLYPPPVCRNYYTDSYGDFIFSPSRLTPMKRIPLLLRALKIAKHARAVIAGEGEEEMQLRRIIQSEGLEDRVVMTGHASEEQLLRYYATCRAVYYAPLAEDFGLVTLEAFASRKPVLTARDSGGPVELVRNEETGFIVEPTPESVASCIEMLFEGNTAEVMGENAIKTAQSITWPNTVSRLLGK